MQEAASNGYTLSAREAKKLVDQYDRLQATAGKTRLEMLNQQAAARGVTQAFSAQATAIQQAAHAAHSFSINNSAARREMLVLAHEASQGQWKRFAGSMLVMAEASDALSLIMSPLGVSLGAAAGTAAAFAAAMAKGAAEAKQFNAAIQLTNNFAGLTAASLGAMQFRVAAAANSGLSQAGDVLRGLASTGRYTSKEMEGLAEVILRTSKISGAALDDVSKEYANLADDPMKWATEHNRSMHFMDAATYEHIKALQDAGDKHQAVQAVIEAALSQVQDSSAQHLKESAGYWRALSREVDTFWVKVKQGLSSGPSLQDRIDSLQIDRAAMVKAGGGFTSHSIADVDRQIANLKAFQQNEARYAQVQAEGTAREQAAVAALQRMDTLRDQVMTNAQKRQKELAQLARDQAALVADGKGLSAAEYQKMVGNINEKYKDPKRSDSGARSAWQGHLAKYETANAAIAEMARQDERNLKAQYDIGVLNAEDYYRKLEELQTRSIDQQIANAQKRVDVAKAHRESATYQTAIKELQALQARRVGIEQDLANTLEKLSAQRASNIAKFSAQETAAYGAQLNKYADARHTRFMLADEKAKYDGLAALRDQYERKMASLAEAYSGLTADRKEYDEKARIAGEFYRRDVEAFQAQQEEMQAVRESFGAQFKKSYADLVGSSQTTAEAVASGFRGAFDSVSSALDTFITTGKASFSSFATSVLADLAKIALRQAEIGVFKAMASSFGYFSDGGPVGHFASGGAISGPGTGTSDSIPAMLSNGEFVVNAASTKKYRSLLESINSGHMAHFATGGIASSLAPSPAPMSGSGDKPHFTVNLNGGRGGLTEADVADMVPQFQTIVDIQLRKRMAEQGGYAYLIRNGLI
ncbi:phage tail length tape measure family protein [Burkholderia sp. FL-7-2-10-S1-D7]|uniref:phage tail length tape measure family protein n=1 Tax=Burkholderia sp. FL-7-2-10-S1-D7 TaxID=1637866 RepID=UPI00211D4562|nr:phage tail length tape measure family protein [Burkholderia sp. FL-7-2-10-S1-D7]